MDAFVPLLCLMTGSVLTLAVLGLMVRRAVNQLSVASAYRDVAQELGLQVDTRGISVRGHLGGRRIWIGEVLEQRGTDRLVEVRGMVGFLRPLGLGVNLRRRGRADRLLRRHRANVPLGDPLLDRTLEFSADDAVAAQSLLTPLVRGGLQALLRRWPDITVTDDDLQIRLPKPQGSATELHDLVTTMTHLAEALEAARRDVPAPSALQALLEPWTALATRLGIELEAWLPAIRGSFEGHDVLVVAHRLPDGYGASIQLGFQPHPDLGLLLRPQVEPDGYWSVGQDIQVGDPRFDAAFVVKGYDPGAVRARLSDVARARLLELRSAGPILVDDRGLLLRGAPLEPDQLEPLIRLATAAARALGW